ncbi:MAG TPA: nuclear transport factor 2 family protein [Acidimicrobiia bacterium]|nr:nuclear transport factor 2 family protein [Acidimicrobiia bacterium]
MHIDADALVEFEAIKRLKYRYLRCLDQKLWDELEGCFVPEAVATYGGGAHSYEGRDAIVAFLRDAMGADTFHTSHRVHQPEITLLGDGEARATWAFDDVVVETGFGVTIRGAGFYEDEYVKIDGEWRIRSTGYKRTFEEMEPRPESLTLTASWWQTGGRSSLGPS